MKLSEVTVEVNMDKEENKRMMMVSDEENDCVEIDHQALATELAQLAQKEEKIDQKARRNTYADIKLRRDAEK